MSTQQTAPHTLAWHLYMSAAAWSALLLLRDVAHDRGEPAFQHALAECEGCLSSTQNAQPKRCLACTQRLCASGKLCLVRLAPWSSCRFVVQTQFCRYERTTSSSDTQALQICLPMRKERKRRTSRAGQDTLVERRAMWHVGWAN